MSHTRYFARDYAEARRRFWRAAEQANARVESHVLDVRGPADEELAMDVVRVGPRQPSRLLAVNSGLHGVEAFVGSALQTLLLDTATEILAAHRGLGLLLVHAVNPFGFAHLDRANERNVDLNRNFVAHPAGHRPNPDYETLADDIAPASLDDEADRARLDRLGRFVAEHGARRFENAVSGGQYTHPRGLYFGGHEIQWSAERLLGTARTAAEGVERVAWIDVHTGLGASGQVTLLSDLAPAEPAYQRAARWYGSDLQSLVGGEALSVVTHGSLDVALLDALGAAREATMVTAEIGTRPPEAVFFALRARNWLRHHGELAPDHPRTRAILAAITDAFDPRDDRWRERALLEARRSVAAAVAGLGAPASAHAPR